MMEIDVTKGKTEPRNRGDLNPSNLILLMRKEDMV